jgi:lipopolysaccharide exporter
MLNLFIRQAKAQAASHTFFGDVLRLASGTVAGQMVAVISIPVLASIFPPASYGGWSEFANAASVLVPIANLRLELGIVATRDDDEAARLAGLSLIAAIIVPFAFALMLQFPSVLDFVSASRWSMVAVLLPLYLVGYSVGTVANQWLTRKGDFVSLARRSFLQSCILVGSQILYGIFVDSSARGLICGAVLAQLGTAVWMATVVISQLSLKEHIFRPLRQHLSLLGLNRNYPLFVVPYGIINGFSRRVLFIVLIAYSSAEFLGWLELASRLMLVPVSIITAAMSQVFFRKAAMQSSAQQLGHAINRVIFVVAVFASPAYVCFAFFVERNLVSVLGDGWRGSGALGAYLALPAATSLLVVWLDRVYDVLKAQRWSLLSQIAYLVTTILALNLATTLNADPYAIVFTYSVVTAVFYVALLFLTLRIAKLSPLIPIRLLALGLTLALAWTGIQQATWRLDSPIAALLVTVVQIGGYLAAIYLLRRNGLLARLWS